MPESAIGILLVSPQLVLVQVKVLALILNILLALLIQSLLKWRLLH